MTKEELANIKKLVTFCKRMNIKVFTNGQVNFSFNEPLAQNEPIEDIPPLTAKQILFAHTEGIRRTGNAS